MATYLIDVRVQSSNARQKLNTVNRELKGTEKSANRLRKSLGGLFVGLGTLTLARELASLGDAFINIENRIKTVTRGQRELTQVTEGLFSVAQRTRQSFQGITELYARVGVAAKSLGADQKELLRFTESVGKAVALSGATAGEAAGALRQLAQAIGANRLSGQELNSVLEQTPVVVDVIAEKIGVTRGAIRALANDGQITGKLILEAFESAAESLDKRFGKTVSTIQQSFTRLGNSLIKTTSELEKSVGIFSGFAEAVNFLADNLELVSNAFSAVILIVGVRFVKAKKAAIDATIASAAASAKETIQARSNALERAKQLDLLAKKNLQLQKSNLDRAKTSSQVTATIVSNVGREIAVLEKRLALQRGLSVAGAGVNPALVSAQLATARQSAATATKELGRDLRALTAAELAVGLSLIHI